MPVLGFRIDNIAYITDASYIEKTELNKLLNLDILIINALRIEKHYSYFNVEEAIAIAEYLCPKKTYFTHISHSISHEECDKNLPKNMAFAYDELFVIV